MKSQERELRSDGMKEDLWELGRDANLETSGGRDPTFREKLEVTEVLERPRDGREASEKGEVQKIAREGREDVDMVEVVSKSRKSCRDYNTLAEIFITAQENNPICKENSSITRNMVINKIKENN